MGESVIPVGSGSSGSGGGKSDRRDTGYDDLTRMMRAEGLSFADSAADAIEALAAENARLREALDGALKAMGEME